MLNHPTFDKLLALRLTGMAKALSEQMDLPESQALSFEERLGLLVDREMTARSDRRLTTRLRQAKLRLSASLEDIDYRHPRGLDKALMLRLARRMIVVIVEPRLADGDDDRVGRDGNQVIDRHVRFFPGIVRMRTDRAEDALIARRNRLQSRKLPYPRRDAHHRPDAGRLRPRHDGVAVGVEIGKIEMTVTIDKHAASGEPGEESGLGGDGSGLIEQRGHPCVHLARFEIARSVELPD